MTEALAFDSLVQALHHQLAMLPDYRTGQNTQYAIKDAALGAFAVFFTQSPAFLAYQRTMKQAGGARRTVSSGWQTFPVTIESVPCWTPWPRRGCFRCSTGSMQPRNARGTCPRFAPSRASC